jgi:myosin protein heavy chain
MTEITTGRLTIRAARKAIEEAERANTLTSTDLKASEHQLRQTEGRLNQVQAKLDEASRQISDFEIERRRMLEEMEDARDQHQKELSERDFTVDQTRKKYQGKLYLFIYLI